MTMREKQKMSCLCLCVMICVFFISAAQLHARDSVKAEKVASIVKRLMESQQSVRSVRYKWERQSFYPKNSKPLWDLSHKEIGRGPNEDTTVQDQFSVVIDRGKIRMDKKIFSWHANEGRFVPRGMSWCYVDGISKRYNVEEKVGTIARHDESRRHLANADLSPSICAYRLFDDSLGLARPHEVRLAGRGDYGGHPCLVVEKLFQNGHTYRWALAEDQGHRPVSFRSITSDGDVVMDVSMQYEPDETIGWRLASWISTYPRERSILKAVVSEVRFNEPVSPETFDLEFPPGTKVYDDVGGVKYTKGEKGAQEAAEPDRKADTAPDYSALLQLTGTGEGLRLPTSEEIKKLGPLWPTVPPEENAAYYFAKANKELIEYCKRSPEPPGSASTDKPYAGDAAALVRYVQNNHDVLRTLREGLSKPDFQVPCLIIKQTGTPCSLLLLPAHIRNLARFLSDAGFADELGGRPDTAAERYIECFRMGKKVRQESLYIVHLVGIAVQAIGRGRLNPLIANATLDETTLKRVIAVSRSTETTVDDRLGVLRRVAEFVRVTMAMSPQHALVFGKDYDAYVAFMENELAKPLPELLRSAEGAAKEVKEKYPVHDQAARSLLGLLSPQWARYDLDLRILQIRAAIALYEKAHNASPDSLDALVPAFLPEVPMDPFSGKPLRYVREGENWKLWSFGYDLKDDGGAASLVDEKGRIGPDFVYTNKVRSNIERRSRGKIKELPELKGNPVAAQPEAQFGPLIEGFVHYEIGSRAMSFEYERRVQLDSREGRHQKHIMDWIREQMADALGQRTVQSRSLSVRKLIVVPVSRERWDASPNEAIEALRLKQPGFTSEASGRKNLSGTFFLKTRQGDVGILQLDGFTENPRGVKIRYKMIQPAL